MRERRAGETDRRASKRGGRRSTDPGRAAAAHLRLKWGDLDATGAAAGLDAGLFDENEALADFPNPVRRPPSPPRK